MGFLQGVNAMKGSINRCKGMPYVRKEYIKGSPLQKITKFMMGNCSATFPVKVTLLPLNRVQIKQNAIESARITSNKILADKLGETEYCLKIRIYPHVIVRENKMMAFAGADRIQEGMRHAFGKPVGLAARVNPGQSLIDVFVNKEGVEVAKMALKLGGSKMPSPCIIETTENKNAIGR